MTSSYILHELAWKLLCPKISQDFKLRPFHKYKMEGKNYVLGSSFFLAFVHMLISISSIFSGKVIIKSVFLHQNHNRQTCLPWTSREIAKYNHGISFKKTMKRINIQSENSSRLNFRMWFSSLYFEKRTSVLISPSILHHSVLHSLERTVPSPESFSYFESHKERFSITWMPSHYYFKRRWEVVMAVCVLVHTWHFHPLKLLL